MDGAVDLYQPVYEHEEWGGTRRAGETSSAGLGLRLGMGKAQVGRSMAQHTGERVRTFCNWELGTWNMDMDMGRGRHLYAH